MIKFQRLNSVIEIDAPNIVQQIIELRQLPKLKISSEEIVELIRLARIEFDN